MLGRRRTLLLTGASRGIGHAAVKKFSAEGWRVLTVSRHPFDERCPWEGGAENHVQLDLQDISSVEDIATILKDKTEGYLDALINNAAVSPKAEDGKRMGSLQTSYSTWLSVFNVNFFSIALAGAGAAQRTDRRARHGDQHHLDRRQPRPPLRRLRLRRL